jgi:hypothetical protein
MSLNLGLGLGLTRNNDADTALVRALVNTAGYTASVSGVNVSTVRATTLLCPFSNVSLGNNVPCTRRFSLGGKVHDAFGAWQQVLNLVPGYTLSEGLSSFARSGITRTLVENSSTTKHTAYNSIALSNSTVYLVQGVVKRAAGTRNAIIIADTAGANTAGIGLNLTDGTSQAIVRGNGVATSASSKLLPDGSTRFSILISSPNWGGTVYFNIKNSITSPGTIDTYAGDGVSSVVFTGVSVTTVVVPFPLIGEATTVNADIHTFTIPTTQQTGAALFCGVPIYWGCPAGGPSPVLNGRYYEDGSDTEGITIANNNAVAVYGSAAVKYALFSAVPLQSPSVPRTLARIWTPTKQELWKDGFLAATGSGTYTWVTRSSVNIGNTSAGTKPFSGLVVGAFCQGFVPSPAQVGAWGRSVVRSLIPLSVPIT